mmetsp:Transcript_10304/g.32649  ORF Transcript_10304/g.32649 Transcript_10304/m.32649 type:complete len:350 (-) Transcript_10304:2505-3554(-)
MCPRGVARRRQWSRAHQVAVNVQLRHAAHAGVGGGHMDPALMRHGRRRFCHELLGGAVAGDGQAQHTVRVEPQAHGLLATRLGHLVGQVHQHQRRAVGAQICEPELQSECRRQAGGRGRSDALRRAQAQVRIDRSVPGDGDRCGRRAARRVQRSVRVIHKGESPHPRLVRGGGLQAIQGRGGDVVATLIGRTLEPIIEQHGVRVARRYAEWSQVDHVARDGQAARVGRCVPVEREGTTSDAAGGHVGGRTGRRGAQRGKGGVGAEVAVADTEREHVDGGHSEGVRRGRFQTGDLVEVVFHQHRRRGARRRRDLGAVHVQHVAVQADAARVDGRIPAHSQRATGGLQQVQ